MNIRDLEYLIAVNKFKSFSKAAEACNVSQPSLSAQIIKLEKTLQLKLFNRSNKSIEASDTCSLIIDKAKKIVKLKEEIESIGSQNILYHENKIKLGAILTVGPYIFPKLLSKTKNNNKNIKFILKEGKTEELIADLISEKLDAAIVSLPSDSHIFESKLLFEEDFYLAFSKKHELSKQKLITEKVLKNYTPILLDEGHCFREQALEVCRNMSTLENSEFLATSLETIREYLKVGNGVTLMPEMAIKNDSLKYVKLPNKKYKRKIGIIWKKNLNRKLPIDEIYKLLI